MIWVMLGACVVFGALVLLMWVDDWWQRWEWMFHPGNRGDLDGPRHAAPRGIE
jgi:hypothetical protein